MVARQREVVRVEMRCAYSTDELVDLSGLPRAAFDSLVAVGVFDAAGPFATEHVALARAARRLREHFELDDNGLGVAVALLRRVRALEARVAALPADDRTSDGV